MALRVSAAFATFNFPWLVGLLGLIFPLNGWDWIWLGFGVGADIFSYS